MLFGRQKRAQVAWSRASGKTLLLHLREGKAIGAVEDNEGSAKAGVLRLHEHGMG